MSAMFSSEEVERYARHIVLREVGGPGQGALKRARVLVIGAGGLGAPVLLYLAAAGVGTLGVIDDDEVSVSNLQRQVIHATPDVGRPKVLSAAEAAIAREKYDLVVLDISMPVMNGLEAAKRIGVDRSWAFRVHRSGLPPDRLSGAT